MKPKKETTAIAFRASLADVAEIDQRAELAGLSRAEWVAQAVAVALGIKEAADNADSSSAAAGELDEIRQRLDRLEAKPQPPRMYGGILRGEAVPVDEPKAEPVDVQPTSQQPARNAGAHSPDVVAAVIAWTVEGMQPGDIATQLNAKGYKPVKGDAFHVGIVRNILQSPTHSAARKRAGLAR